MTKSQIRKELTSILLQMGIPLKAITDNASYYKDLGLDSLDFTEMIMECELRLGIDLQCTDVEDLKTVRETVDYVSRLVAIAT